MEVNRRQKWKGIYVTNFVHVEVCENDKATGNELLATPFYIMTFEILTLKISNSIVFWLCNLNKDKDCNFQSTVQIRCFLIYVIAINLKLCTKGS